MEAADGLFPPLDPQNLGTTHESDAASKRGGGQPSTCGVGRTAARSTPCHPHPAAGPAATPPRLTSPKPGPKGEAALEEPEPLAQHLTCCVTTSTQQSLAGPQVPPWNTGAEALVLSGSRVAAGTGPSRLVGVLQRSTSIP